MQSSQEFIPAACVQVEALQNTPDATLYDNIKYNSTLALPWLEVVPMHTGHAVVCGGGSSLKTMLPEIILRQRNGHVVYALNGAAQFLAENGVTVDCQIVLDARVKNREFVEGRYAKRYLIASQCHPAVFGALEGADVTLWHMAMPDIEQYLPKGKNVVQIMGSATCGLAAMAIMCALGYQFIHLYGYDSSDAEGSAHAYAQDETSAEKKRLTVKCVGREFSCSFGMYKQAESFPQFAQMCADMGHTISVHGDGLLPTIAREMTRERDRSVVVYDLSQAPASWDFATWLIKAEMMRRQAGHGDHLKICFHWGPDKGFRADNQFLVTPEYRQMMFDKVVRPLIGLIGAEEVEGVADGVRYGYLQREITDAAREGAEVPHFKASEFDHARVDQWLKLKGIRTAPLVITLREATHWPQRNSNLEAWLAFASKQDCPVVFVRDTEKAEERLPGFITCPIASEDIRFRAALYARARCNLFKANGPPYSLCVWGDAPYLMFGNLVDQEKAQWYPGTKEWWMIHHGLAVGEQYPWASAHQRMTWTDDTLENIEAAWTELRNDLEPQALAATGSR